MSFRENTSPEKLEKTSGSTSSKKAQEILGDKVNLSFKPIHQQVQEENEKKQQLMNKKTSLFPDLEIDEKLLNLLMPSETFNEDDFDYFQHFGSRRFEPSHAPHDQMKEDVKRFKELRSKVVVKEDSKEAPIFLAKEASKTGAKKANLVKLKPKTTSENEQEKEKGKEQTVAGKQEDKKAQIKKDPKASALVDYSSGDSDLETSDRKKVKLDNKKII